MTCPVVSPASSAGSAEADIARASIQAPRRVAKWASAGVTNRLRADGEQHELADLRAEQADPQRRADDDERELAALRQQQPGFHRLPAAQAERPQRAGRDHRP